MYNLLSKKPKMRILIYASILSSIIIATTIALFFLLGPSNIRDWKDSYVVFSIIIFTIVYFVAQIMIYMSENNWKSFPNVKELLLFFFVGIVFGFISYIILLLQSLQQWNWIGIPDGEFSITYLLAIISILIIEFALFWYWSLAIILFSRKGMNSKELFIIRQSANMFDFWKYNWDSNYMYVFTKNVLYVVDYYDEERSLEKISFPQKEVPRDILDTTVSTSTIEPVTSNIVKIQNKVEELRKLDEVAIIPVLSYYEEHNPTIYGENNNIIVVENKKLLDTLSKDQKRRESKVKPKKLYKVINYDQ